MIKPEHLIEGERYGLAHNPFSPCVHYNVIILTDNDRTVLLNRLTEYNENNFHHKDWFVVVKNFAGDRWEIMEVPVSKSRYALFSED